LLPEERLRLQFRQPGFLEARTTGFVRPELNTYALLVDPHAQSTDTVVGYVEGKGAMGVDRSFGRLFASLAYNVQVEHPFTYQGALDSHLQDLGDIVLSFPQLLTSFDFRDNPVHPHSGVYLANDLQIAGGPFGGKATDLRVQPEVRTYVPISRGVTFATRASVGFLFAQNYGDHAYDDSGDTGPHDRDISILYFRGFFSGGPSQNRGYPLRGIAPHGFVPFLTPRTTLNCAQFINDPKTGKPIPNPTATDPTCQLPIGGFSLWELSNEVRFEVAGPFAAAAFCDMGDVSPYQFDLRFTRPHLSCGVGARYDTPVGPIRLDIGYRIPWLQVLGQPGEDGSLGVVQPLFNVKQFPPMAVSFGIGEAF
jgi:outer membrane protein insertion porin family/translocation and assembly module TamA